MTPTKIFFRSERYRKDVADPRNQQQKDSLTKFLHTKRKDITQSFGNSDKFFSSVDPFSRAVPGLAHAHLSGNDKSIVYRVEGNKLYLYGIYSHDELGIGIGKGTRKAKATAQQFKNMIFTE